MACTQNPDAHITLLGGDADAWTWCKQIRGRCACSTEGSVIYLETDGARTPAVREGDAFRATISLSEGQNRVRAICQHPDGERFVSEPVIYTQRLRSRPRAVIHIAIHDGVVAFDGSASAASLVPAPITAYVWTARASNPAPLVLEGAEGERLSQFVGPQLVVEAPAADGEYYVSLLVVDACGRSDRSTACFVVREGSPGLVAWERENTAWVEQAIVYGVVPHNLGTAGFRSVTDKLDYLRDLGINAIWLCPINSTPSAGHGYAVTDYFELRADYGSKADLRELVNQAHDRGIRVLMDFVPNHSSSQHRYLQDALEKGAESPYYCFYDRDEAGQPTHYFHWEHLPNLNYSNPEVETWMLEAFNYWVREFDVDGFRVDAVWGVKQRRPEFAPRWRRELQQIKADLLLLAEAGARDPYYFDHGYDAAYDWTDQLGHWAMEAVFEEREGIVERLHAALTNEGRGFHPDALIFRFLNNNDTGPRFITRYGLGMTRVAAAMLLTLPGIPCVYTGQEVGAEFEPYKTPGPISEDTHGLRDYYKRLIALRKEVPSLHSRRWLLLDVGQGEVCAYLRFSGEGGDPVLVLLNYSGDAPEITLALPPEGRSLCEGDALRDLLVGETLALDGSETLRVPMNPWSARILRQP